MATRRPPPWLLRHAPGIRPPLAAAAPAPPASGVPCYHAPGDRRGDSPGARGTERYLPSWAGRGGRMRALRRDRLAACQRLAPGSHVVVHERGVTRTGATAAASWPATAPGWLTRRGPRARRRRRVAARRTRAALRSSCRQHVRYGQRLRRRTEDGPATTPAGSRSRASDTARSALHAVTTSATFRAAVPC